MRWRLSLLLLALAGCSDPAPADAVSEPFSIESEGGLVEAVIELGGGQPVRGDNLFYVTLDPEDAELTAASGLMLAHGHGSDGAVTPGAPSQVSIDLFMTGRWDLTFEVLVDAQHDHFALVLDVP